MQKSGESIGIAWKRNALRHEFCSARLAVTRTRLRLPSRREQSGDDPKALPGNAHRSRGQAWFNIMPPT